MTGFLIDTPMLKLVAAPKPTPFHKWCEANDPDLYISAASVAEIALGVEKTSSAQPQRATAMRAWLKELTSGFGDRIHAADAEVCAQAGALMPKLAAVHPRFRTHDALLVATARVYGHGLVTRRDEVFGPWTQVPIAVIS